MIPEHKEANDTYHLANIISPETRRQHGWLIRDWKKEIEACELEAMMIRKYHQASFYLKARGMTPQQLTDRLIKVDETLLCLKKELDEAECAVRRDYDAREYFKQNPQKPFVGVNLQQVTLIQTTLF